MNTCVNTLAGGSLKRDWSQQFLHKVLYNSVEHAYDLILETDLHTRGHTQWYSAWNDSVLVFLICHDMFILFSLQHFMVTFTFLYTHVYTHDYTERYGNNRLSHIFHQVSKRWNSKQFGLPLQVLLRCAELPSWADGAPPISSSFPLCCPSHTFCLF